MANILGELTAWQSVLRVNFGAVYEKFNTCGTGCDGYDCRADGARSHGDSGRRLFLVYGIGFRKTRGRERRGVGFYRRYASHPDPSYNGGHTGHYEAVKITYDPAVVDYQGILDHFWVNHDPFDARGQFCDKGHSYLAAIFVGNDAERALAEKSKQKVIARFPDMTVVTPILPRTTFFPIKGEESYHQDYYKKSPLRYRGYRWGCGRDQRLSEIWGDLATH